MMSIIIIIILNLNNDIKIRWAKEINEQYVVN